MFNDGMMVVKGDSREGRKEGVSELTDSRGSFPHNNNTQQCLIKAKENDGGEDTDS